MNISSVNTTAGYSTDKNAGSGPVKENSAVNQTSNLSVTETASRTTEAASTVRKDQVNKSEDSVKKSDDNPQTTIERSVHEETNHIVYKVKNKETGEIIREIPEEKLLDMAAMLMEINGLMIDKKI